jgi:hypothetical protein
MQMYFLQQEDGFELENKEAKWVFYSGILSSKTYPFQNEKTNSDLAKECVLLWIRETGRETLECVFVFVSHTASTKLHNLSLTFVFHSCCLLATHFMWESGPLGRVSQRRLHFRNNFLFQEGYPSSLTEALREKEVTTRQEVMHFLSGNTFWWRDFVFRRRIEFFTFCMSHRLQLVLHHIRQCIRQRNR